jgi:zinc transporter, ZIP family
LAGAVKLAGVFLAALGTALATGLGALPLLSSRAAGRRWLGLADAAAGGFMLAASLALAIEGAERGPLRLVGGALLGALFILVAQRLLRDRQDLRLGALRGADARKAVTIVAVMTIHSLTEGIGVGVSFGGGKTLGVFITAAIAIHNIPEGLAISLVLVPRGTSVREAAWWSVFSSLPQPLLALPAYLFVEKFKPVLPAGLGFAAGAMVWLVVSELIPDAREGASNRAVAGALGLSFAAMMALQALLLNF